MGSLHSATGHRQPQSRITSLGWRIAFMTYSAVTILILLDVLRRTGAIRCDVFSSLARSEMPLSVPMTSNKASSNQDVGSAFTAVDAASLVASQRYIATKVAAIAVTKLSPNLIPLVLHFSNILGPQWPIHIYTSPETWIVPTSAPFLKALNEKRVLVNFFPAEEDTPNLRVPQIMSRPWFWEQLRPATHVLLFSTNTVICSNSQQRVDDYVAFDFVGAPAESHLSRRYREELSLWNGTLVYDILQDDLAGSLDGWYGSHTKMTDMYARMLNRGAKFPSNETARSFAASTPFHHSPLGIVNPTSWDAASLKRARSWCPEIGLM